MSRYLLTTEDVRTMTTLELLHYLLHLYGELNNNLESIESMTESEVNEVLRQWLIDGTLSNLISDEVLSSIEERIDEALDEVNKGLHHVPLIPQPVQECEQLTYPLGVKSLSYDLFTHVPLNKKYANFQGLATFNGHFYVGEDDRNSEATYIHKMSYSGNIIDTKQNNFGHVASISHRKANGHFYVASGGQEYNTIIWEYDFETNMVLKQIDLSHLSKNALVCVDNANDELILVCCEEYHSPITMYRLDYNGIIKFEKNLPSYGVPQGISCFENRIYYQTGENGIQGYLNIFDSNFNHIDTHVIYKEQLKDATTGYAHEPQGIEVGQRYGAPIIFMMWANPMRIYAYQPHDVSKFQSIELYGTANNNIKQGTCLMPRVYPFYLVWDKTTQTFNYGNADNVLASIKNIYEKIETETIYIEGVDGPKIQFNLFPRIEPSVFIDMHVSTTIKYRYMGVEVVGNVQYMNQCFRIGILVNGKPISNISEIPDGLEIFGTATVGMRLSR